MRKNISITLAVFALLALGNPLLLAQNPQPVASTKLLQLQDSLQKDLQQEAKLRQSLYDKINYLATMLRDFDDSAASMNGLSGLGRVEQLQFKAERYAAERQARKQIEKEVLALVGIIQELQSAEGKVTEWQRLIEAEKKLLEVKASIDSSADGKLKDGKGTLDPRNFEYYTVKKSGSLKEISALPEVYSNPNAWKYLYDANRDKIATPETTVSAGTVLIVPNIKTEKTFINME